MRFTWSWRGPPTPCPGLVDALAALDWPADDGFA